ncbi:MAG: DUF1080 domain-containing protein [Gemmataceae bacterium]
MRRSLVLIAALALPLLAADDRKPNTLTPKEVAEGWLLLFDGETTFGWVIDGEAKVEKGELVLGGTKPTRAKPSIDFTGFAWRLECLWTGEARPTIQVGAGAAIPLRPEKAGVFAINFGTTVGPRFQPFAFTVPAGSTLRLRAAKRIPIAGGNVGPMDEMATVVKDQGFISLLYGNGLAGWKVYKGEPKRERSKWTVTREGWLNVKDGPGDLQTEKLFDDFVLQFDCVSNGKHLNSGLFFRCEPGKYQQGYEAQIRNQFTDKPTQKYPVEEYDPKTHKLVGKKEVMSTAIDYGTGAIYRRVPARKGIAKDGEWFTMTVVARGRHIATWVNGVQVVDWTDNRPEGDNARTGYRSKAGAISIQGHDPTTDLSFRNIRVAPLPR